VVAFRRYGFMAPAATPGAIVDRLQAEVIRALADPEVKQKLLVQGLEATPRHGRRVSASSSTTRRANGAR